MSKRIENFTLESNKRINDDTFIMVLKGDVEPAKILPGQFAEVEIPGSTDVFLRRPFSIHEVDYEKKIVKLFIKIVGKGSRSLSELSPGSVVNMIYPLGNHFSPVSDRKVLLVGGGTGVAPLLMLARYLYDHGASPVLLIGGRSKKDVYISEDYSSVAKVFATTEDGSFGQKGLVTDHRFLNEAFDFAKIYSCGPEPMMKAVSKIATTHNVPCEVSLENTMACGIGACLCCVTNTVNGNVCVCTEGPVFDCSTLNNW